MNKKLLIFAVSEETSDETLKKLFIEMSSKMKISEPIIITSDDLSLNTSKPNFKRYINDIANLIETDSFNKIKPTENFWIHTNNKTAGFDKECFIAFLSEYNVNENLREFVQAKHFELVVKLISQAVELM